VLAVLLNRTEESHDGSNDQQRIEIMLRSLT
jgi:hypothetical protein